MVGVVARNIVKAEDVDEFIRLTEELIEETRREEGCIDYHLMRDYDGRNILTFIEMWESMEHLEAHFETAHFKRIVPVIKELREEGDFNLYRKCR